MHMLYNSDQCVVVAFEVPPVEGRPDSPRGGYEIVDKFARKEIYLQGVMAEHFQQGVQALVEQGPSPEALDEYIARFTAMAQQPVVLH